MLKLETKGNFEVLNFGMGAYKLDQKHDLMKAILKKVEADLVIVGFHEANLDITTKKSLLVFARTSVPSRLFKELQIKEKVFFNPERNFGTVKGRVKLYQRGGVKVYHSG
jgi:hypothetical protein